MRPDAAWSGRRFEGLTCLVVGGGVGIGRACAIRFAAEGGSVVVADLEHDAAAAVVEELDGARDQERQGERLSRGRWRGDCHHRAVAVDVLDGPSVSAAFSSLERLDVLVVVAGGDTAHGAFESTGDDVWRRMFELNLLGTVRCVRAALPLLRARWAPANGSGSGSGAGSGAGSGVASGGASASGSASVVMVGSVNALTAMGSEPYSGAKAGLSSLASNLAVELGGDGVRVNLVAPATVRTRVWEGQPGGADRMRPIYPLGRVGEPDDIAAAIAFLASRDAAWITGVTLPVDGGLLAGHRVPADGSD